MNVNLDQIKDRVKKINRMHGKDTNEFSEEIRNLRMKKP